MEDKVTRIQVKVEVPRKWFEFFASYGYVFIPHQMPEYESYLKGEMTILDLACLFWDRACGLEEVR